MCTLSLIWVDRGNNIAWVGAVVDTLEDGVFAHRVGHRRWFRVYNLVEVWIKAHLAALKGRSTLNITLFVKTIRLNVGLDNISALTHFIELSYLNVGHSGEVFERVRWHKNFCDEYFRVVDIFILSLS